MSGFLRWSSSLFAYLISTYICDDEAIWCAFVWDSFILFEFVYLTCWNAIGIVIAGDADTRDTTSLRFSAMSTKLQSVTWHNKSAFVGALRRTTRHRPKYIHRLNHRCRLKCVNKNRPNVSALHFTWSSVARRNRKKRFMWKKRRIINMTFASGRTDSANKFDDKCRMRCI